MTLLCASLILSGVVFSLLTIKDNFGQSLQSNLLGVNEAIDKQRQICVTQYSTIQQDVYGGKVRTRLQATGSSLCHVSFIIQNEYRSISLQICRTKRK